jgi:hypothetical protein
MPRADVEADGREVQAEKAGLVPVNPDAMNQPDRGTDDFTDPLQKLRANPHVLAKGETADGNHPVIASTRAQDAPRVSYDAGANEGGREWVMGAGERIRRMTDEDVEQATTQDARAVKARVRAEQEGASRAEARAEAVRVHEESGAARAADERARTEREAASANEDAKQRATAEANRRANDK